MTTRTLAVARPLLGTTLPFALPIGLSAFLLFSVEPLIGRLVLPVFGGTPAVWATVLFFFQAVLLARLPVRSRVRDAARSLGTAPPPRLGGLAVIALVVAPSHVATLRDDTIAPVVDLIRILVVLIGLPALVLTTTTPLVSGWFEAARAGGDEGDGYWLYALSNAGSLLALLAYPLLIEPRLSLTAQRGLWSVGYVALVVLLAIAGSRALPALARPSRCPRRRRSSDAAMWAIDWHRRDTLAPPRRGPVGPALRGHDVHRDRPRLRAIAVGRASGDLSPVIHHRLLAAWQACGPLGRRRRSRDDHDPVGALWLGGRMARPCGPRHGARRIRGRRDSAARAARRRPTRPVTPHRVLSRPVARWRPRQRLRGDHRSGGLPGCLGAADPVGRRARRARPGDACPATRQGQGPGLQPVPPRLDAAPRRVRRARSAAALGRARRRRTHSRPRPASAGCSWAASCSSSGVGPGSSPSPRPSSWRSRPSSCSRRPSSATAASSASPR